MVDFARFSLAIATVGLLGLGACDRTEERVDRAQTIADSALRQLMGEAPETDRANSLESAPLDARAVAGQMLKPSENQPRQRAANRYVLGSIVAKPKYIEDAVAIASVQSQPELAEDIVVDSATEAKIVVLDDRTLAEAEQNPEVIERIEAAPVKSRSITVVDPNRQVATRSLSIQTRPMLPREPMRDRSVLSSRTLQTPPTEATIQDKVQALPQLQPKVAQRALTMKSSTLNRQIVAEDRMISAATKYGLAASIQRSRTGQMVIEIGDEALKPTQFTTQQDSLQYFAYEKELDCGNATRTQTEQNVELAMECVMEDLRASGEFEYVEKDYVFEHQFVRRPPNEGPVTVEVRPNDPLFDLQWHYHNRGTGDSDSIGGSGFVDFWSTQGTQGSKEVVVAVIDTGLELGHPDIQASDNVAPGWDMVTDPAVGNDGDSRDADPNDPGDACPANGVFSDTFHGTHVAGTIGAGFTNNSTGVAGGAWNVKIVPVRALGKCGGRLSDINDAIRWAAGQIPEFDDQGNEVWNQNPADIINLSIGLFRTCPASMQDAIDDVTADGVTVVAAAGNDRVSTNFYAPAGCNNVLTVASGDARGHMAPYSNFGSAVDLIAPGGDLTRDDNGDGKPDGVLSSRTATNCFDPVSGSAVATCFYAFEQGTSMAAPHVSAALALIMSAQPDLTSSEAVVRLIDGLTDIPQSNCTGACSQFPGATQLNDGSGLCLRPCGGGALDLGGVSLAP